MRIVLGIDGGGTHTQACIADESGRVLGAGSAGPGNFQSVGVSIAVANIVEAERQARAAAGIGGRLYDAVFLGLAGVGTPTDRAMVFPQLAKLPVASPTNITLDHDMRIAHAGALAGRPGIVVIAGTGSACFGVDDRGGTARACGWGSAFDDPGSAYDLGRRAISEVLAAADGRSGAGPMTRSVAAALGADLRKAVLALGPTGEGRAKVAALAPQVIEAAAAGDAAAIALVLDAVAVLALGVKAIVYRLQFISQTIDAAIVGGLTQGGSAYTQPLHEAIHRAAPQVRVVTAELPPVLGAVILALRSMDVSVECGLIDGLKTGAK